MRIMLTGNFDSLTDDRPDFGDHPSVYLLLLRPLKDSKTPELINKSCLDS